MAYYIKSEKKVADKIGAPTSYRNRTADGKILLWQADLLLIPGDTILDKAAFIGGAALTPVQAREEIDGTCAEPAEVFIPDYYADKVDTPEHQPEPQPEDPSPEEVKPAPEETPSTEEKQNVKPLKK